MDEYPNGFPGASYRDAPGYGEEPIQLEDVMTTEQLIDAAEEERGEISQARNFALQDKRLDLAEMFTNALTGLDACIRWLHKVKTFEGG